MDLLKIIFLCIITLLFLGCSPKTIVKKEVVEVKIPIKCDLKIPNKPNEDGSFESHKNIIKYFLEVEDIAKSCTGYYK